MSRIKNNPFRGTHLNIDFPLLIALILLSAIGMFVLYSASGSNDSLIIRQSVRLLIGFVVLILIAQTPVRWLKQSSWILYWLALIMLLLVFFYGDTGKGAQRWLDLGFIRFQPSELMKLAMPMMMAAYFSSRRLPPTLQETFIAFVLLVVPMFLIVKQPDLGTALLVGTAGAMTLFFAGMSWRLILLMVVSIAALVPIFWKFVMHPYQKQRVLTLLDPESDPLGSGYHIIQSKIALGSGGLFGKGWLRGTQSQLQFIPERTTDFIFSVFGEEFGFWGVIALFVIYLFIIFRCLTIALFANDTYARLLAASFGMLFFVYFFVNIGMVSGILPVVGVPLPLISYGGTSMVTIMASFGIIMSISSEKRLMSK